MTTKTNDLLESNIFWTLHDLGDCWRAYSKIIDECGWDSALTEEMLMVLNEVFDE